MKVTQYDYEPVHNFWVRMRTNADDLLKCIESNLVKWQAAAATCQGAAAINSAVDYLTKAKSVAQTIVDAAETGNRLNEQYAEQLAEAAKDFSL